MYGGKRNFSLLANTAARKSPSQLLGIVSRKARSRVVPRLPIDVDERYRRRVPDELETDFEPHSIDTRRLRLSLSQQEVRRYQRLSSDFNDGYITFLNRTREIPDPADVTPDDSRLSELPRLWFLKLAAFEPLLWGVLGESELRESGAFTARVNSWLDSCIERERIGHRTGYLRGFWTPYAVSLRIIALARYGAWQNGLDDAKERFLYKNLLFLANNVEQDVGGNHLIENGAALFIGGSVFPEFGSRFLHKGLNVLRSSTETQFLDDGYHFERSPMYHLAVTERLLSTLSILTAMGRDPPNWLVQTVTDTCGFAKYLRPPDGRIPLLNDAVFDQAHRLETVISYASLVGVDVQPPRSPGESGLRWFESDQTSLLIDMGNSGPKHQMAHIHNDPCTILLWNDGNRMVTDTGVYDYQPGDKRTISRSIRSHNTVQVGDSEPVDYGGRFRMGDIITTTTTTTTKNQITAHAAEYEAGETESYHHRRTIYHGDSWLLVWDAIAGSPPFVSRLHAHPKVAVQREPTVTFVHEAGSELRAKPIRVDEVKSKTGLYFPKFGIKKKRPTVEFHTHNREFGYFIFEKDNNIELECTGSEPTAVHVNYETHRLPEIKI